MISLPTLANSVWPEFENVNIIRGDELHPIVSGNKLYKLLPILNEAQTTQTKTLISVGGRYSNHPHALAWASKHSGMKSVGLVRGYSEQPITPTLKDCMTWGMDCHFITNQNYLARYNDEFWLPWLDKYPFSMRIDEGGWGKFAIEGSAMWWQGIPKDVATVVTAIGSGSTYAGLLMSKPSEVEVIGVPVFKDADNYSQLINKLTSMGIARQDINLWQNHAGRGFGKLDASQLIFKSEFEKTVGIELDPVYTTKTFHALAMRIRQDSQLRQQKIAIIHTGGLQGNRSIKLGEATTKC